MSVVAFYPEKNIFIADTLYATEDGRAIHSNKIFKHTVDGVDDFIVGVVGGLHSAGSVIAAVKRYRETQDYIDLKVENEVSAIAYIPSENLMLFYDYANQPVEVWGGGLAIGAHAGIMHLVVNTAKGLDDIVNKAASLPAQSTKFCAYIHDPEKQQFNRIIIDAGNGNAEVTYTVKPF